MPRPVPSTHNQAARPGRADEIISLAPASGTPKSGGASSMKHEFFLHRRRASARRWVIFAPLAFAWLLTAGRSPAAPPTYTLAECVALAGKQNPDVLAAAKRVDAARATITAAKGAIYPALTSNGYYQYREQEVATEGGNQPRYRNQDYVGDVRVSQNLYSGGAVRKRIDAAKLQTQIGSLELQTALDTATLGVRTAFYQTLYAEANIGVRQQAVDLLATQLKDQKDRFAAGSVGQINVNRAQVTLTHEQPELIQARTELQTAYVGLSQVLGIAYPNGATDAPFRVRGSLEVRPLGLTKDECVGRALSNRPEITARKIALDVLGDQLVIEKSATRPQISAFAAYDIYSEPDLLATHDNFSGYTVGLQGTWTLFDGFATRGRVRGVVAQRGAAEAQLVATRLSVEAEVRNAFDQLRQAEATLRPQAENITLANETLQLTSHNFDAGLNTQLDVLDSRVQLTRAQSTELAGRLAYNTALARLERAMGLAPPDASNAAPNPRRASKANR